MASCHIRHQLICIILEFYPYDFLKTITSLLYLNTTSINFQLKEIEGIENYRWKRNWLACLGREEEPPRIYGFIVSCFRIVNSVNTQARARARFSSLFTSPRLGPGLCKSPPVNSTERGKDYKITFQLSCFVCNDHDFPSDSRAAHEARSFLVKQLARLPRPDTHCRLLIKKKKETRMKEAGKHVSDKTLRIT